MKTTNLFVRIPASELSLADEFMQHVPKSREVEELKEQLTTIITRGIKDFWRPILDPTVNDAGNGICYKPSSKPAVGHSCRWWKKAAKDFDTKHRSKLGTKSQYVAFLGVLIKLLVAEGKTVPDAWHEVARNSVFMGHYWDSIKSKHEFELTMSRNICGFFDLGNTCKILAADEDEMSGGFWLAGGHYCLSGMDAPLSDMCRIDFVDFESNLNFSVGWIICEECPNC